MSNSMNGTEGDVLREGDPADDSLSGDESLTVTSSLSDVSATLYYNNTVMSL